APSHTGSATRTNNAPRAAKESTHAMPPINVGVRRSWRGGDGSGSGPDHNVNLDLARQSSFDQETVGAEGTERCSSRDKFGWSRSHLGASFLYCSSLIGVPYPSPLRCCLFVCFV